MFRTIILFTTILLARAFPSPRHVPHPLFNISSTAHAPRATGNPKLVIAHMMVGNTYAFTPAAWTADIALAQSAGIDGFALNVGSDVWQPDRVADAYASAQTLGTGFKLFFSFDMSVLGCADAAPLRKYITTYASHPNQLIVDGKVFASTFAGESCTFGQGSVADGWRTQFTQHPDLTGAAAVHFVPAFFIDPATFSSYTGVMDGAFNFNSGWPINLDIATAQSVLAPAGLAGALSGASGSTGLAADAALASFTGSTTTDDQYRAGLATLGSGLTYMAAASPWFFTHYAGSLDKNFMYLSDNHLYATRWENLIATRDSVDIVELLSFNDFGESHYLKDPTAFDAMPAGTTWVPNMTHAGWLDMTAYYAAAFKTGAYPAVTEDAVYMWARPHARSAAASADALPPPTNFDLTQDAAWVVVLARAPGMLTLQTGGNVHTYNVAAGANKLSQALSPGDTPLRATLSRNNATVLDLAPQFTFYGTTDVYNYNALVVYAKTS